MPLYVYSKLVFHWGFSVRVPGTSGGGPSLPLPPPSTLAGSIAYAIARLLGWRETTPVEVPATRRRLQLVQASSAYRLARYILAAGATIGREGSRFMLTYRDRMRYQITQYQKEGNLKNPIKWFASINFGVVVAPNTIIEYVLVFEDELKSEGVDTRVLEEAAWSQVRLGAREGLVTVIEAHAGKAVETSGGSTKLYAVEEAFTDCPGFRFEAWDPRSLEVYMRSRHSPAGLVYCAPSLYPSLPDVYIYEPSLTGTLRDNWPAYKGKWPLELGVVASLSDRRREKHGV